MLYMPHCLQYEARRERIAAAMAINRAICDPDKPTDYTPVHDKNYYRTLFEADPTGGGNGGNSPETSAQISYCLTADPDINVTTRNTYFGNIKNGQVNYGAPTYSERSQQPWKRCVYGYSGSATPQYGDALLGHTVNMVNARLGINESTDGARRRIAPMANAHFLNGCNQYGLSYTTGFGPRWYCSPLHDDGIILGQDIMKGAPDGVTTWGGGWSSNIGNPSYLLIGQGDFVNSFSRDDSTARPDQRNYVC